MMMKAPEIIQDIILGAVIKNSVLTGSDKDGEVLNADFGSELKMFT